MRRSFLPCLVLVPVCLQAAIAQPGAATSAHDTFLRVCSACHSPDVAAHQPRTSAEWQRVVGDMRNRGALGSDQEFARIIDYLSSTHGLAPNHDDTPGAGTREWTTYGGDLANQRYSFLDQIDASNFNRLQIAWRFNTANFGRNPEYKFESTPLMARGVVYTTAGARRDVVALDAGSGEILWMHREEEGARGEAAPRQLSGRGLAYWRSGEEERILYVTPGYRLIALNAKTGHRIASFGQGGIIDLKQQDDQTMDLVHADVGLQSAPVVAGNTILIGAAHSAGEEPVSKTNVKGYVRGYDVRTGRRLWIFHTLPRRGETGFDSWEGNAASYTGNTGVWGQMSVDEALGLVYLPVEMPTGDAYGGDRPGNGLFGESLVAVDLKTGKRRWHYQLVHHGLWDYDIPCAPVLVDLTVGGVPVKALAQPGKQSILYVLDRETGKPIWPFVEQPVPQGDVPGEWYSPTQPIPSKPPAYGRNGFSNDQLMDFTPALRAEALEVATHYRAGPLYTPPVLSKAEGPLGTLIIGFSFGGTNWPGGSFDPQTHTFYVFSQATLGSLGLVPADPRESDVRYVVGLANSNGEDAWKRSQNMTVEGMPMIRPPYGQITALDLDHGTILWQAAHGDTPDEVRNSPLLKGVAIPRTGRPGIIGLLTTRSLVIAGEAGTVTDSKGQTGALLRAYDKRTGKDAGAVPMPTGQTGSPMTYMWQEKQYIVVAVGGAGQPGELLAYTLPEK